MKSEFTWPVLDKNKVVECKMEPFLDSVAWCLYRALTSYKTADYPICSGQSIVHVGGSISWSLPSCCILRQTRNSKFFLLPGVQNGEG